MKLSASKKVLDKGFVITRNWVMLNQATNRGEVIKELRKHSCTLLKDNSIKNNRGETIVTTTEGQALALGWNMSRLAFTTK